MNSSFHHFPLVILALSILSFSSCSSPSELGDCALSNAISDVYVGEYMFDRCTSMTISASTSKFDLLEPVQITFTCLPAYTGTGVLQVQFLPLQQSSSYHGVTVEQFAEPILGTYWANEEVTFEAGEPFQRTWTVRVQDFTAHHVSARAGFTDVCDNTGNCYPIGSEEADRAFGPLDPNPAANYPPFVLAMPRE